MTKRSIWLIWVLACLVAAPVLAQSTPVCGPLDDGRVANVFYEGTAVFFEPIVEYEYDLAVLTISGPCEDIVRTFKSGEGISFDIREIERVTDGHYTWQLRFEPTVDPGVREDLQASRGTGKEEDIWWSYWQKGAIPVGPRVDSASFTVFRGGIIDPDSGEEKSASLGAKGRTASVTAAAAAGIAGSAGASGSEAGGGAVLGTKDQVIPDDLIVQGSACVGFDCVNGESFGFDTIRLKENNTRIQFNDTSSTGSFPTNNWQIRANSSSNGGGNFLAFVDQNANDTTETGTLVFVVEADAGANALFVDSTGRVGLGTGTPVLDLHISSTNTPGLRLEQTSGGGFTAQTWDIAGNEANFFVRDVTGGSRLPFRIFPGANSSSLVIDDTSNIGIGTTSPSASLHVRGTSGSTSLRVEEASGTEAERVMLNLVNNGNSAFQVEDTSGDGSGWQFKVSGPSFRINKNGSGGDEIVVRDRLDGTGNATLVVNGSVQATNVTFTSSRDYKTDFVAIDTSEVLQKVASLPMSEWRFKDERNARRHIGPVAEDFNAAFDLGGSHQHISVIDANGITMAAVQGLYHEVVDLRHALEERDQQIERLEEEKAEAFEQLRARLEELEAAVAGASGH